MKLLLDTHCCLWWFAQAQIEEMTLMSADSIFKEYSDISILLAANSGDFPPDL